MIPVKVIELFAGIGSQTQALKNIGVEHEVVGISNSQLYKQAGNSIVVDVLERIFRSMFLEDKGNVQDTQMEFL